MPAAPQPPGANSPLCLRPSKRPGEQAALRKGVLQPKDFSPGPSAQASLPQSVSRRRGAASFWPGSRSSPHGGAGRHRARPRKRPGRRHPRVPGRGARGAPRGRGAAHGGATGSAPPRGHAHYETTPTCGHAHCRPPIHPRHRPTAGHAPFSPAHSHHALKPRPLPWPRPLLATPTSPPYIKPAAGRCRPWGRCPPPALTCGAGSGALGGVRGCPRGPVGGPWGLAGG